MKLVKTIVRPDKVDEVRDALEKIKISGMTVTDVRGHGRQKGHTAVYRGKEYSVTLLPKVQVEVVVPDNVVEEVIQTSSPPPGRAKSATAASSCCRLSRATTSGPANGTWRRAAPDNDVRHIRWAHKNVGSGVRGGGQSGREGPGFGRKSHSRCHRRRPAGWR